MVELEKWDAETKAGEAPFPMCYLRFRDTPDHFKGCRTIEILDGELLLDLDSDGNVIGVQGIGINGIGYVELVMVLSKIQVKGGADGFG